MRRTSSSHCGTYCFSGGICFSGICGAFSVQPHILQGKGWRTGDFYDPCAVILWFCGYSVYNSEIFTMGRIWQGKAVLAGVFLPFLFLLCMEIFMQEKPEYPWSLVFLANGACCLFSSMGIMLAPLLMGVFALLSLVKFRDGRRFLKSVVCCLPSLILGVVYILVF